MEKYKILIVDDEEIVRESLYHWFEEEGYGVESAEDAEAVLRVFESGKYDLMLVDMKMPGMSGLDLLEKVKEIDNEVIFILITAFASVPSAIRALKDGAFDYITKPIDPEELSHIVEKAISQKKLRKENILLKSNLDEIIKPDNLVGSSPQMKKIFNLIHTVAPNDTTVMLRGESGTGKEVIARTIHINSNRKYFPMITVNCGALSESLLESELFGHEKGAFTGAMFRRKGKFEMADGGTIFLDEIGTISQKMQIELLRVLESKSFYRVGGNELVKSNFRVITATNENLENLVKEGKFREDLYYRLNVFSIFIPPLRERRTDIEALANYFLERFANSMNKKVDKIDPRAMEFLIHHSWYGNVRELENAIERAVVVCRDNTITLDHLPFHANNTLPVSADDNLSLASMEKRHISRVLFDNNWNVSRSAEILGIDRVTLYNKISKYKLSKDQL